MGRLPKTDRAGVAGTPLTIRLTAVERALLNELVRLRQEELGRDATVSQGSYLRALIREKADAKGIKPPEHLPDQPPRTKTPKSKTKSKAAAKKR